MLLDLGICPGTPWRPSREGTQKNMKKSLLETLLLDQICDRCWHFCGDVFHMFSEPLYFQLFAPAGAHMTQFRRLLATKLGTDWANLQKWKQWFRVGESIKIKPFRTCRCAAFVTFSYTCCKPVFFVIPDLSLSHSSKYGYPFGIHFEPKFTIISASFFWWLFRLKIQIKMESRQGTSGTS